jgi:hypothetical protein
MQDQSKTAEPNKPKQGRSPAYPAIPLKTAIDKAHAQFNVEGKYAAPMTSAFKAWGYSEKSSGGRAIRAALRYFGLISIDGDGESGKVKLTEDAINVILDKREDQTERRAIIRRLALMPAIHQKLVEEFPDGLGSDNTVEHYLTVKQGYNVSAAKEVIAVFKETAAYAGLFEPDRMLDNPENQPNPNGGADLKEKAASGGPKPPIPPNQPRVNPMDGERIVFTEESDPQVYLKVVASGEVGELLLDALDDYVRRQRRRLAAQSAKAATSDEPIA